MNQTDLRAALRTRLNAVEERIQGACRRAGRRRDEVTLVAVTKTVAPEVAALLALLLPLPWPLFERAALSPGPDEPQTVFLLLAAFRALPCGAALSRARPCVTRWTSKRTSPIGDEMRVTPCPAGCAPACRDDWAPGPSAALRGAGRPARRTGIC